MQGPIQWYWHQQQCGHQCSDTSGDIDCDSSNDDNAHAHTVMQMTNNGVLTPMQAVKPCHQWRQWCQYCDSDASKNVMTLMPAKTLWCWQLCSENETVIQYQYQQWCYGAKMIPWYQQWLMMATVSSCRHYDDDDSNDSVMQMPVITLWYQSWQLYHNGDASMRQ